MPPGMIKATKLFVIACRTSEYLFVNKIVHSFASLLLMVLGKLICLNCKSTYASHHDGIHNCEYHYFHYCHGIIFTTAHTFVYICGCACAFTCVYMSMCYMCVSACVYLCTVPCVYVEHYCMHSYQVINETRNEILSSLVTLQHMWHMHTHIPYSAKYWRGETLAKSLYSCNWKVKLWRIE